MDVILGEKLVEVVCVVGRNALREEPSHQRLVRPSLLNRADLLRVFHYWLVLGWHEADPYRGDQSIGN